MKTGGAEYEEKLTGRMEELLRERRHRLALWQARWTIPVKKLSGGYAFVEDGNHQALRSIHEIAKRYRADPFAGWHTDGSSDRNSGSRRSKKWSDELKKKEPGLEEQFAEIDAILDAMEDENVTLDRSFALYKEGLEQIQSSRPVFGYDRKGNACTEPGWKIGGC